MPVGNDSARTHLRTLKRTHARTNGRTTRKHNASGSIYWMGVGIKTGDMLSRNGNGNGRARVHGDSPDGGSESTVGRIWSLVINPF